MDRSASVVTSAVAGVDRGDRRLEQHLNLVVAVEAGVLGERRVGRLTAQEALREGWAVVGQIGLLGQQRDPSAAVGLAVGLDRTHGGQAAAGNH